MLPEMSDKEVDIEKIAKRALADKNLLSELLAGLKFKNETIRYNCSKVLDLISGQHGNVLYPEWQYFVDFLSSQNTYWKLSALLIITNLTSIDMDNRFEKIFDKYYQLLDDKSMITAIYAARSSGKIVRAKPALETEITNRLLNIDETHHESGRKDLIKAGIIEAFSEYYEMAEDKSRIVEFVRGQLNSGSPKTRKTAKEFLSRL